MWWSIAAAVAVTGLAALIGPAAVTAQSVYYLTSSCPGPASVTVESYGQIAASQESPYAGGLSCSATVTSTTGGVVLLVLTSFSVTDDLDYLTIYDSAFSPPQEVALLTGSGLPSDASYSSSSLTVVFSSAETASGWSSGTGFTATVSVSVPYYVSWSCPGPTYVSTAQYDALAITPDASYTNDMSCGVILYAAQSGSVVTVAFREFDTRLNLDVVTLYDGPSAEYTQLAALSGSLTASSYSSVRRSN